MIKFEWGPEKDTANQRKHSVSFEEVQSVFFDENAVQFYNALEPYDDAYMYYLLVAKKGKVPDDYFEQVKKHSRQIGFGIRNVKPQSLGVIDKFRASNYPWHSKNMQPTACSGG